MVASTVFTCGKFFRRLASTSFETRIDSSSDVDGIPVIRNMMEPSCSWGMNSLPRKGNRAKEPISSTTAMPTTRRFLSSAQSSSGRYTRLARATMKVSFSSLGLRIKAASTGTKVSDRSSEPAIAKVMVRAIGLNSFPSKPLSENSGMKTTMMMRMANAIGLATSRAASRIKCVLSIGPPDSFAWARSRKAFSTMTTAPSTIIPVPIANPASDIRLAERPNWFISRKAMSMASGRVTMTTTAERTSPRNRNRTIATSTEPSTRALSAVFNALATISVRS
mmetsp:Transcript_30101/g.54779  ORF Transcript_30101/g.54779 Transcript_30101/m.54779 type:complete len:279 (+) Transcript_30101:1250-2086(+)